MSILEERRQRFETLSETFQPTSYHHLFFNQVKERPQQSYIYSQKETLTYEQTGHAVKALAMALKHHNLGQAGQHVTLIFPNYAELIIAKLATSLIGHTAVPINYRLNTQEMGYLIQQSDSNYIITIDTWRNLNYIDMFQQLFPEVFEGKVSPNFPQLKKIVVYSPEGHRYPGTLDYYDLINEGASLDKASLNQLIEQDVSLDRLSDIMYTSGTTSKPKGVLVTHDMVYRAAMGSCLNRGYEEGRKIFIPIPLYHCFGYIIGLFGATIVGGSVILQDDFNDKEALQLIRQFKADDMLCVPTIALHLANAFKSEEQKQPLNLHAMYCAGAEVPIKLWKDLREVLEIKELITGYGMTELASGVLQTDPYDQLQYLVNFVGKTIPGGHLGLAELKGNNIEFKIRDLATREFLHYGQEGELVCRGPLVTKGYYNKPDETSMAHTDGWLNTGDLAIIHDNGYVTLTGRLKEIYRIGAENVAPKEIEEVLTSHEAVSQAYVVGVPDPIMGEVGLAWIVLENTKEITESELTAFLIDNLARFKVPKYIKFIDDTKLPKTATGKIQKFRLKELFQSKS